MPVKTNPTKEVKCPCGLHKTVEIEAATAYCKATDYTCSQCKKEYRIIDYMNGCIVYYEKPKGLK